MGKRRPSLEPPVMMERLRMEWQDGESCQLCGNANLSRFEIPGRIQLWKCEPCELFQYGKAADNRAYAQQYHAGYAKHRERKIRTAICRLNRAACFVESAEPRLLDVGCSVGCTLEAAKVRGWNGYGVDISEDAVEFCRNRGLDARTVGSLSLPFDDCTFDVLVAWHVIEHVEDVSDTLAEWHRVLKPNGLMVLETPDASSPRVRRLGVEYTKFWPPEHTYAFTPANLAVFMQRAGLDVVAEPRTGALAPLGFKMGAYSLVYHSYLQLRRQMGVHKAFQLFAKRPSETGSSGRVERLGRLPPATVIAGQAGLCAAQ